jgi:hypothetical protein
LKRVLVLTIVSRTVAFAFVAKHQVYAHKLAVFAFEDAAYFSILQSSLHYHWAWQYSSTLRQDLNYSPSDVFQTFPFPNLVSADQQSLGRIGERYHDLRRDLMRDNNQGLTETYNRFHDANETAACIARLRALHVEMDQAVAAAYGWGDLPLDHGFHATAQGVRYTVSEAARRELLRRLLHLNHERYAQEVQAGLHAKAGAGKGKGAAAGEDQLALL